MVTGFSIIRLFNPLYVICDNGYMTGVAYIQMDVSRPTSTDKSLYLVVILDIIVPTAIPNSPKCTISIGINIKPIQFGATIPFEI
jgi:hypothetical protein